MSPTYAILLAHYDVAQRIMPIFRQLYNGIRVCIRLYVGRCAKWFPIEHTGAKSSLGLLNTFFAVVINTSKGLKRGIEGVSPIDITFGRTCRYRFLT